jgi:endonuclease/exonuclease/phosphatase family metal-dependent hydrolase
MRRSQHAARALRAISILLVLGALAPWTAPAAFARPAGVLKVMSYNVYYGGRLEDLFLATSPEDLIQRVGVVWDQVQMTDLPGRAEAVADEIAAADPHVVGLQETPLWRSQFPGDGSLSEATSVRFDFLTLLLDALEARGRHYAAVSSVENLDAELPRFDPTSPTGIEDIRLTDRDVILARTDLPTKIFSASNPMAANFANVVTIPAGIFSGVTVPRGWTSVDVTLRGTSMRVVNTHLERVSPFHQVAQGQEIIDGPAATPLPVVLLGDMNSAAGEGVPGESETPTYDNYLAAGFVDVWATKRGRESGFTCCQSADLDDPSELFERIDFVFVRNGPTAIAIERVGEEEADRTDSGFWPSDHAGLSAVVRLD